MVTYSFYMHDLSKNKYYTYIRNILELSTFKEISMTCKIIDNIDSFFQEFPKNTIFKINHAYCITENSP